MAAILGSLPLLFSSLVLLCAGFLECNYSISTQTEKGISGIKEKIKEGSLGIKVLKYLCSGNNEVNLRGNLGISQMPSDRGRGYFRKLLEKKSGI